MREHGAFVVPTLVTYDALARDGARLGLPADSVAKIESVRQAGRDSLKIYAEHGVPMGFGSDLLGEMHESQSEEFLIRAEILGNLETIRSATSIAAAILQREGELGTVRVGARADLIVVNGNSLDDIGLLTGQGEHLALVMQSGYVHRSSL